MATKRKAKANGGAAANRELQRAWRQRKIDSGLAQVVLWVKAEHKERLKNYAKRLA